MILLALALGCAPAPEEEPVDEPFVADCPWGPSEGTDIGQIAQDLAFDTCDGSVVSLHDQCGAEVTMVVYAFGWCIPCVDHIGLAAELQQDHPGLNVVVVLAEDALGDPPTETYCTEFAASLEAGDTWVLDPTHQMDLYGGPGDVLILDGSGIVRFNRDDAIDSAIVQAVEDAFAANG